MKSTRLSVIHWFPLEQYPPVTNLLDYFASETDWKIDAFACANDRGLRPYENANVAVHRRPFPSRTLGRIRRLIAYLGFPVIVFFQLLRARPDLLLSIEPQSALPAFLYCLIFRRCRLFIHYHEYRDQQEYFHPGMRFVRFNHWIEKKFLYSRAEWVSQTNADRNRMFLADLPEFDETKLKILPNYPPPTWLQARQADWTNCSDTTLRLVYVGALSLRDTFIGPLVEWLRKHTCTCDVTLDIYSYNNDRETREFLESSTDDRIRFHSRGIEYSELPALLADYHVGLILYRANTRNYVYNASNKLFEYLALGLDVWYPPPMLGVKPYANSQSWPRVLETDFENMSAGEVAARRDRSDLPRSDRSYDCHVALDPLHRIMAEKIDGSEQQ